MSAETNILTGDEIDAIWEGASNDLEFARAIEQAVLDSPEVVAMRRDAERYRWLRKPDSNVPPITHAAARDPDLYDAAIDAAMEMKE